MNIPFAKLVFLHFLLNFDEDNWDISGLFLHAIDGSKCICMSLLPPICLYMSIHNGTRTSHIESLNFAAYRKGKISIGLGYHCWKSSGCIINNP